MVISARKMSLMCIIGRSTWKRGSRTASLLVSLSFATFVVSMILFVTVAAILVLIVFACVVVSVAIVVCNWMRGTSIIIVACWGNKVSAVLICVLTLSDICGDSCFLVNVVHCAFNIDKGDMGRDEIRMNRRASCFQETLITFVCSIVEGMRTSTVKCAT